MPDTLSGADGEIDETLLPVSYADDGTPIYYDVGRQQFYTIDRSAAATAPGAVPLAGGGGVTVPGAGGGSTGRNYLNNGDPFLQQAFGKSQSGGGPSGTFTSITDANGNVIFFNPLTGQRVDTGINVGGAEPPWFVQRGLQQQDTQAARDYEAQLAAMARQFQAHQANIDRAIQAEQFAQNLAIQRRQADRLDAQFAFQVQEAMANRVAQARRDRVAAARELANVVSMADPLAQQVFGQNLQGAIASGAEALTSNAIEPAAQIQSTLSGNPIDQARETILNLRRNTQLPTLFANAASGDDLGLQNVGLAQQAQGTIQGYLNALQARTGASTGRATQEINRLSQTGVNRRSISLTSR